MPRQRIVGGLGALLVLNSAYLAARNDATLFYVANVLLHPVLGILLVGILIRPMRRWLHRFNVVLALATVALIVGTVTGFGILTFGATRPFRPLVSAHIASMSVGLVLLPIGLAQVRGAWRGAPAATVILLLVAVVFAVGLRILPTTAPRPIANSGTDYGSYLIANDPMPPRTMEGEMTGGRESPFFPSAAETSDGEFIPSEFFLNSESCGASGCHPDIYRQWSESVHRFSSFNNQWYRRSITYMQEVQGTIESSKWCAGCHDPAVLLTGLWTKPMKEQLDIPEANAGLGCVVCHSAVHVKNTMGNGGLVYEYPPLDRLAQTDNALVQALHDYVTKLDPAPHRETFMKPFLTEQTAEFCSSCHKVHLDEPVNNFRWVRGFNEYDAWQTSGVSGQGALSFYYPPEPQTCADCHMPLVPSDDKGNIDGFVHNHRFPAANTAVPYVWGKTDQVEATEAFLKSNVVTLDIFGMTIGEAQESAVVAYASNTGPQTMTFTGDETQLLHGAVGGTTTDVTQLIAPLDRVDPAIRRGDSARISVVVRTRGVGHRFPGGTFDAFDVWVELEVRDENGKLVFHSGGIEPDGRVDRGAHFYRAVMLDAEGNIIDKRNAFHARSVLYARGIPPGSADTVHFRLNVPEDVGDRLTLVARLHYRKFSLENTRFAYAGVPNDDGTYGVDHDNRTWRYDGDTSNVAGLVKEVPNLPIVTLDEDRVSIRVLPANAPEVEPRTVETELVRERWNDYGIGLLLQGDLKGARIVFEKVTRMDPDYPDGWVNVARAALQEGDLDAAEASLREAIRLLDATLPENPNRAKAHYFLAQVHIRRGDFDDALRELEIARRQYPRDGRILNAIGRVKFLTRDFRGAIDAYLGTLTVDPENLTAHYNLMLAYQGIGDRERAREHQARYQRFKADESKQAITGKVRREYPELNLERQAIREHYNMTLPSYSPIEYGGRWTETGPVSQAEGRSP